MEINWCPRKAGSPCKKTHWISTRKNAQRRLYPNPKPAMPTVIETLSDYFFHLQYNRSVTAGTLETYRLTMKHFCNIHGSKSTIDLTPTHIIRFKQHLREKYRYRKDSKWNLKKISEGFLYSSMIRLKAYLKWLSERWHLNLLKPSDVPINKIILQHPKYLSQTEIKVLFQSMDKWVDEVESCRIKRDHKFPAYLVRAIVRFLYATGLRNAELRSIKMNDINLDSMTGTVLGKGKKYGFYTFNQQAKNMLLSYLNKRKEYFPHRNFIYLFSTAHKDKGRPISANCINRLIQQIGEKAWIEKQLSAHVFRHTCATHLLDAGANIVEVQHKLRHANIDTTALYTHVSNNRLTEITKWLVG